MTGFRNRIALGMFLTAAVTPAPAGDWPTWAGGPARNPVSFEKGLPLDFQLLLTDDKEKTLKPERGVAWKVDLGNLTVIPPVVADGLVWVGTNARDPNDEKIPDRDWDGGVLMCFRESDGKLIWKHRTPRYGSYPIDFPRAAIGSAPLVEGDRLWYTNNRNEVVCYDIGPLKKGTGIPKEVWKLDTIRDLKVFPHRPMMQFGFAASVAGYKDKLYVVTHNAVDDGHIKVPFPNAPSLVCLEKTTGKVIWQDNSPGKNILEHQISSPLVAEINGQPQVIVAQGDGWLRAFDADTGKFIWKCDLNPKSTVWEIGGGGNRNYVVATPLLYENRVYVATGVQVEAFVGPANLYCIDPTKEGDISLELNDGPKKGKPNPKSAVVWHTPRAVPADAPRIEVGQKKRDLLRSREFFFGRSVAGCVAHDGLVYAADVSGFVYCFDAKTGKLYWVQDLKAGVRGQLLWADGKVLVATEQGDLYAFEHGKEKKLRFRLEQDKYFFAGPIFANGTLYLTTDSTLFAIRRPK